MYGVRLVAAACVALVICHQMALSAATRDQQQQQGGDDGQQEMSAWVNEALQDVPEDKRMSSTEDAQQYLMQYGYYGSMTRQLLTELPTFLRKYMTQIALKKYQKLMGIPDTGEINDMTMKMMSVPRCGMPDTEAIQRMLGDDSGGRGKGKRRMKRYVLQGNRWRRSQFPLTYRLETPTRRLEEGAQVRALAGALQYWSDASGVSFRRIGERSGTPDLAIAFARRDHNDRNSFDGPGRVLAHAFYPGTYRLAGDAHFDDDERWVIRQRGQDLVPVAVHEFGHSLGLSHSNVRGSIMWPTAGPYRRELSLHQDDINGIRALYGPPQVSEATTPMPTTPTRRPTRPTRRPTRPTRPPTRPTRRPTRPTRRPTRPTRPPTRPTRRPTRPTRRPTRPTRQTPRPTRRLTLPTRRPTPPTRRPQSAICDGNIDAMLFDSDRETMAFKDDQVYELLTEGGIADGYPRPISDEYIGYPENTRVTAAAMIDGRIHLFAPGSRVYRVERSGSIQEGSIMQSDIGIPDDMEIRAAFDSVLFRKAYLFTDTQYYRYSMNTGTMDPGYPKSISAWGLPVRGTLSAATIWRNGRVYFFYDNDDYYRFNIRRASISDGYPRSTSRAWFGCRDRQ